MTRRENSNEFTTIAAFLRLKAVIFIVSLTHCFTFLDAQTTKYTQFWNEYSFTHTLKQKFALEFNLGQSWTSTPPEHKSMFSTNAQVYARTWVHYYFSPRWKFSVFLAYFYNKDVPEISQRKAPELRMAYQAMYFFKKIPFTLNARARLEDRKIKNDENVFEATYRLRLQLRCIYPINNKFIRQGTVYGIGSDEIMLKTGSLIAGTQFFDRNRLTIGGGYAVTDDLQLELTYVNEFLPRDPSNELVNAFQVNVCFNNLFANLKKKLFKKHEPEPASD